MLLRNREIPFMGQTGICLKQLLTHKGNWSSSPCVFLSTYGPNEAPDFDYWELVVVSKRSTQKKSDRASLGKHVP